MNTSTYKVLFLEDEPTIREVLTEYVLISRCEVTAVERGDTAIEFLEKHTYDIAVLDIMVPGADGFAVLEYIQQHCSKTAAIMLTALEDEKTQVKAFNLYADDYVIKPVSPIILLKRMETILRRTCKNHSEKDNSKTGGLIASVFPSAKNANFCGSPARGRYEKLNWQISGHRDISAQSEGTASVHEKDSGGDTIVKSLC